MRTALAAVRARFAGRDDEGFTLVELLAAMGIFSILMAMISATMLSGMTSIGHIAKRSQQQGTYQLVSESVSRLLRYTVAPESTIYAIPSAGKYAITFYSASGFGASNDRPNKVHLWFDPATKLVKMTVMPAVLNPDTDGLVSTPDSWTWATPTTTDVRVLMRSDTTTSPIRFSVRVRCSVTVSCPVRAANGDITPVAETALVIDPSKEFFESVVVSVGDPADPKNQITQQVRLQNVYPLGTG
jgi:prepilin-type N-terminal cleavage/methylation domain-containing protein